MIKKLGIGCGGLVLLIIVIGVATSAGSQRSGTPTTPPLSGVSATSTIPAAAGKTWTVIKAWTGDGIKDTEDFTVGAEWRIDWDYTGSSGIMQIYVHESPSKRLVGVAANTQKTGADTSFQRGAGTYYLTINATGGWKVAVQEAR